MNHVALGLALVLASCQLSCSLEKTGDSLSHAAADDDGPEVSGDLCHQDADCLRRTVSESFSTARRLTNQEYANSIADAFGIDVQDIAAAFPSEPNTWVFRNTMGPSNVSFAQIEKYDEAAGLIATRLLASADFRERYIGDCTVTSRCSAGFIQRVAQALFRAPFATRDQESVRQLVAKIDAFGGDFDLAAYWALRFLLQSPEFLYRLESIPDSPMADGTPKLLSGFELATRLSYFIWHSLPDDELLAAAEARELQDEAGLTKQVRRMLEDPKARRGLRQYAAEWLMLDRLAVVDQAPTAQPVQATSLSQDAVEESLRLIEDVALEARIGMPAIFNASYTYASPALARFYGLTPLGNGFRRYDLSAVPERRGLLTQASVNIASSGASVTNPVSRGLFLATRIFCREIPPPPPGIPRPDPSTTPNATPRERMEQHRASPYCAGCHKYMDPLGFVMEAYDARGALRTVYPNGRTIDTTGEVPGDQGVINVKSAVELGEALAHQDIAGRCLVRRLYQYAVGHVPEAGNQAELDHLFDVAKANFLTYDAMILAVATSDSFRYGYRY